MKKKSLTEKVGEKEVKPVEGVVKQMVTIKKGYSVEFSVPGARNVEITRLNTNQFMLTISAPEDTLIQKPEGIILAAGATA